MQEIKITEEMKADAVNLINALKEFKNKYGLRMVNVNNHEYQKNVTIYGDNDKAGGFNVYYIYSDGDMSETYIKGDSEEESKEIEGEV